MIGIVIELLISWLLLKFIGRQNLNALGIYPTKARLLDFLQGLVFPIAYLSALLFIIAVLVKNPYHLHAGYGIKDFLIATAYVFKAVLYEDLIFRGALLYILIQRTGASKAVLISAISFGIYHWFSWGVFGQPAQMVIVFVSTGVAGYLFALAFAKTRSLYLPFALHLGCDFASMILFSQNEKSIGLQLLTKTYLKDPAVPGAFISIVMLLLYYAGFPVLCYVYLRFKKPALNIDLKLAETV